METSPLENAWKERCALVKKATDLYFDFLENHKSTQSNRIYETLDVVEFNRRLKTNLAFCKIQYEMNSH